MPGPARGIDDAQPAGRTAAERRARAAVPTPLLSLMGQLELEFVLILEPLAPGVELSRADVGFDRIVAGQPRRLDFPQHIRFAQQRVYRHVARRLRVDRTFDVRRTLWRKLTC